MASWHYVTIFLVPASYMVIASAWKIHVIACAQKLSINFIHSSIKVQEAKDGPASCFDDDNDNEQALSLFCEHQRGVSRKIFIPI